MKNFLIGLMIGIGKIIPGVSGSIIAIRFNVYEKIISAIINLFKDFKKNTIFLTSIFSGVIVAIISFSNLLLFFYNKYNYITKIIFAILILTGIKDVLRKDNNYLITIIFLFSSLMIINIPIKYDISYFFMGLIESISMIIPGISGTAIYISLGVYLKMLNLFINPSFNNLLSFFFGFILTSFILLKLINYLLLKYKKETYSAILGFLISSIILMFI